MTNSCITNFLICNHHSKTWIVLQLWYWLQQRCTKYILMYSLLKKYLHKNKHCCLVVNISRLVNLDCVPQWLINPLAIMPSISSAISSVCLVMVLAKGGTRAILWMAVSSKSSWQMSWQQADQLFTNRKGLASVMQLATKNDALSADTFDEVVAFNNCFCSCSHFFLWKSPKVCP